MPLTLKDLDMILQSLEYTKRAFQDYTQYPSYEFKLERIREVKETIDHVRELRKEVKYGIPRSS